MCACVGEGGSVCVRNKVSGRKKGRERARTCDGLEHAVGVAVVVGVVVGVKLEGYGIKEKDRRETRVMAAKKPIRRWFIQFTNGLISTGCWTNRREVARICRDSSVICGKPQLYELKPVKPKRKAK